MTENGGYDYLATFLASRDYAVAFTCQGLDDTSEASEDIVSLPPRMLRWSMTKIHRGVDRNAFSTMCEDAHCTATLNKRASHRSMGTTLDYPVYFIQNIIS
jgi:hypothetical protein